MPDLPDACVLCACRVIAACADGFHPLSKTRRAVTRASPAARLVRLSLAVKLGGTPVPLNHMLLLTSKLASGPPVRVLRPMVLVE